MSSSPSHDDSRDALSGHLDALFELAQVVTSDVEEALSLIELTARRARQEGVSVSAMDPGSREQARIALYQILLDAHAKRSPWADERGALGAEASYAATASFAGRLAERFVDAALPGAFATLGAEQRILLLLCDVQEMSCAEAGRVLNVESNTACERLDRARLALSESVYLQASPVERRLIETGLSGNWRHRALRRMAESELAAIPPTAQPSLMNEAAGASGHTSGASGGRRVTGRNGDIGKGGWQAIGRRAAAVLVVIALAGLVGYGLSYMTRTESDSNLISLSAGQAEEIDLSFQTSSPEQAERFVRDRLDQRIVVPEIDGASLQGISIRAVAEGAEVPVLLYSGDESTPGIVVYAYSYVFLDRHRGSVQLSSDVLNQIEEEGHFDLHDLGETKALVWRHRGDIYIAVTNGDAEALRDRIRFPS